MNDPTAVFWNDLAKDLEDPEFLREYISESVRIQTIDELMTKLEAARENAGLTKADLARSINAEPATVRRLFSSETVNPTVGTISEIAAVLGYTVELVPMSGAQLRDISMPLRTGRAQDRIAVAKSRRPRKLAAG